MRLQDRPARRPRDLAHVLPTKIDDGFHIVGGIAVGRGCGAQCRWRKSSYSSEEGDCAELAHTLNAVRDSKNPGGPTLGVDVRGLLAAIKDGRTAAAD